jgi:hypothetical protein
MSNITSTCKIGERLLAEFLASVAKAHTLPGHAHAESDARGLYAFVSIDDDATADELDRFAGPFAFDLAAKVQADFLPRLIAAVPSLRPSRASVYADGEDYDDRLGKMVLATISVDIDLAGLILPPRPQRAPGR